MESTAQAVARYEQQAKDEAEVRWEAFVAKRGRRYADCRLENFTCGQEGQEAALKRLRDYAGSMLSRIGQGQNVVLYGPKGTGKDHLLAGLARLAICAMERTVFYAYGPEIYQARRDAIDHGTSERDLFGTFTGRRAGKQRLDVLILSDPAPGAEGLTPDQRATLGRIIETRYSDMAAIWVTANVSDRKEFDNRIGDHVVDRLIDGALTVHCNWPSYRKSLES